MKGGGGGGGGEVRVGGGGGGGESGGGGDKSSQVNVLSSLVFEPCRFDCQSTIQHSTHCITRALQRV